MNGARGFARLSLGAIILLASLYVSISLGVAFFKLSGAIVEGQPMYFELETPTWSELFVFQVVSMAILGLAAILRSRLRDGHRVSQPEK